MSFLLPSGLSAEALRELERACVAGGPDNMPWPTDAHVQGDHLLVSRSVEESGTLVVPWDVDGAGRLMSSSATLMERSVPYSLLVEIARGKVNQLRCQSADWRAGGLAIPPALVQEVQQATFAFGSAVTQPPSEAAVLQAREAINRAYRAAGDLVGVYLDQVFQIRHARQPRLDTAFGTRLGAAVPEGAAADALAAACNSVCLPLAWSVSEPTAGAWQWDAHDALLAWAEAHDLEVTAGPLVDFSAARLPDWLWSHERDLSALGRFMCRYVETAVRRYRGRVRRWQLAAASNSASLLSLGEDELLLLTVRMAEAARQVDPALEVIVGLAQPWGEYMAVEDRNHSPFIFADTLIRSGLTLAALDVELVMGVTPRGSYARDLLETSRLLDMYALLGLPLRVTLGYPSSASPDPLADPDFRADAGHWRGGFTPQDQADWARAFATLAVCKPYVQAVHWTHFNDAEPHTFPHAGLVDAGGNVKPALAHLRELREKHLR
ncbi:MAG TPA: endo-1,4-beta-xylanase [Gemmataceae bacterium]|nr:endo-1,4-beta-xylanase [Gemmataceae bacterium]